MKISDMFGRGRIYNAGFIVFAFGSALSGLSTSIGMLIGMRVLQAIGASLLMANSQGIVATMFASQERGRAFGITGAMVSLGSLSGPVIGGLLIGAFGWPSIFWVNVPIGVISFLAGLWILPKQRNVEASAKFDYFGTAVFIVGITSLLYTLSNVDGWGWTASETVVGFAVFVAACLLFSLQEVRWAHEPMLDFSLYRIRKFSMGSVAAFLSFATLFSIIIMIPFYVQDALHNPPRVTGYVMAAIPVTMIIVAPLSGWLSDKIGSYLLTIGGLLLNALGCVFLNTLSGTVSPWLVASYLAVFGIGQGMFQPPNNTSIMGAVPPSKVGIAGGLNALTRNTGMAFGIALSTALFTQRLLSDDINVCG